MSFEVFQEKVNAVIKKAGGGIGVRFSTDDDGRHFADCSDGTTIIGNKECQRVEVVWGAVYGNHRALAEI